MDAMVKYNEVVDTLERALKAGDAPIGERFGCLLSKLAVEDALTLIKSLKAELRGKVEYIDELSEENRRFKNANECTENQDAKIDALIAGQETLQKYIAEKNAEIEKLKKKLSLAECCICDVEDALNRGSDNDWAREHIENYEKEVAAID